MKMKIFSILFVGLILMFNGCGSNSSSSGSLSDSVSGKAIDGYISGATVNILNKETEEILSTVETNTDGSFTFDKPDGVDIIVEISGGTDSSTGEAFTGTMKNVMDKDATDTKLNITPLTSLVAELVVSGKSVSQAKNTISASLGIDASDLNSDPIEILQNGSESEKLKAANMMKSILVVQKFSEIVSSVSSDKKSASADVFLAIAQKLQNDTDLKLTDVMDADNTEALLSDVKAKSTNELDKSKFEAIKELTKNTLSVLNEINATQLAQSDDVMAKITSNASSIEIMLTPLKISLTKLKKATTPSAIIEQKIAAANVITATIAMGGIKGISNTLENKIAGLSIANFAKSFLTLEKISAKATAYKNAIDSGKTLADILEDNKDKVETVVILDFGSLKGSLYKETTSDTTRSEAELGLSNITISIKDSLGTQEVTTDKDGYFKVSSIKVGDVNITIDMSDPDLPENIQGTKKYTVTITKDTTTDIGDKLLTINSDSKAIDPSSVAQCENPISFTWGGSTVPNSTKTIWENMKQNSTKIVDINDSDYSVTLTLTDVNGQFNELDSGTHNDHNQTYDDISQNGVISKGVFGSPYLSLYLGDDNDKNSNSLQKGNKILLKVEFNKPVILDNWLFRDIDSGNTRNGESGWDWQDAIKIVGYDKNNNPIDMAVTFSQTSSLQSDNEVVRTKDTIITGSGLDTTDPKGHARWSSNGSSISYMIVEFSSGDAISNPTRSAIAASGFSFCPSLNDEAPILTNTPMKTIENSVIVEVNGEAGSRIFINGIEVSGVTLDASGKASITLDTSGTSGMKTFIIKLINDNITTKSLFVEIEKLITGTITGSLYKETTSDTIRSGTELGLSNVTITANDGISTQTTTTNSTGYFTIRGLASGEVTLSIDLQDPDIPEGAIVEENRIVIVEESITTNMGDISVLFEDVENIDPSALATCQNPISFTWDGSTVSNSSQTSWTDMANNLVKDVSFGGYNITLTLDDVNSKFNNIDAGTSGIFGKPYLSL